VSVSIVPRAPREAATEAERIVAWLRLPAIVLLALGQSLTHENANRAWFFAVLVAFAIWSVAVLVAVSLRPVGSRFALFATAVDVAAITALAVLSGGAFSNARIAYFLIPVTVAFRFRPAVAAIASAATVAAYAIQAVAHPAHSDPQAVRFILTNAGYLAWIGLACTLLAALLGRQTQNVASLAEARSRLLADALNAEQRERKALAEALHDHAIQNLLSALHDVEEAAESAAHPALGRAEAALLQTVDELRDAIFELHPYVLDEAGLEAALRSIAKRTAARGGLALHLDLHAPGTHLHDQLLYSAARELLANVLRHAAARSVTIELAADNGEAVLTVEDDGRGFDPEAVAASVANGHIGIASQRVRIESAGGRLLIRRRPVSGTRAEVRVPL